MSVFTEAYLARRQAEWEEVKEFLASPRISKDVPSWEYDESAYEAFYSYREGLAVISCYYSSETYSPRFHVSWRQGTNRSYAHFTQWVELKEWLGRKELAYDRSHND